MQHHPSQIPNKSRLFYLIVIDLKRNVIMWHNILYIIGKKIEAVHL